MRASAAIAALSVLVLAGPAAQSVQPARQPAGLIVGQVVDAATGRPVSGCVVSLSGDLLRPDGWPVADSRVLTTSDGRFVFRDLTAGTFGITASKPRYADGAYGQRRPGGPAQQLTLESGERILDVVIHVWKHGAISGTVVDESGEPLVDAPVVAFRRSMTMGPRSFATAGAVVTDDRGIYRFGGLQAGDYIVGVSVRHFSMPAVQGRAVEVSVERPLVSGFSSSSPPTMIQVDGALHLIGGTHVIPPPPANDRMFTYQTTYYSSTPSMAQASLLAISSGEERSGVDLQVSPVPAARVSGAITGPEGPVATSVRLVPADGHEVGASVDGAYTVSDPQGLFTFPLVPAGQYSLQARVGAPRGRVNPGIVTLWADLPLVVGDTDVTGLHVQLQRGLRITGRFEFEGSHERPSADRLQQMAVVIQHATGRTPLPAPALIVEADGRFTGSGLPPDRYFVRINSSPPGWRFKSAMHDGRDVADVPLDLRGDADVTITFSDRWSHLRGTVATSRGAPDPEAIVLLFPTDTEQWPYAAANSRRFKSARASASGEYTLRSVPDGEYFVVAVPDATAADWQTPSVLEALARLATRVNIAEGETRTERLETQEIR